MYLRPFVIYLKAQLFRSTKLEARRIHVNLKKFFGGLAKKILRIRDPVTAFGEVAPRTVETELEARGPLGEDDEQLAARDFDDVLFARDFEDIGAREPLNEAVEQYATRDIDDELFARDFGFEDLETRDAYDELLARDFELEDIEARDFADDDEFY